MKLLLYTFFFFYCLTSSFTSLAQTYYCIDDDPQKFLQAFNEIKLLAISKTGLNMSDKEASVYSTQWSQRYLCEESTDFSFVLRTLRVFSMAKAGLNLNETESIKYSAQVIEYFCGNLNFQQDFLKWFQLGISASGMNLPENEARDFAQKKIEDIHFSCFRPY